MGLGIITFLFFMWGFLTCLNDLLIPHLKALFDLNYFQAMLVQFSFFTAYFIVSVPAGKFIARLGYKKGILIGLSLAAVGCLLFIPAQSTHIYFIFLLALFILASGITILQVAANPYVGALGSKETASRRLTITQAFNSLGTTLAPIVGAGLLLSLGVGSSYAMLALALFALALMIWFYPLPKVAEESSTESNTIYKKALDSKALRLGALGIFLYVGAEVAIGSFLISFLIQNDPSLDVPSASKFVAYYWGGAMVGRFLGGTLMTFVRGSKLLMLHGLIVAVLILIATTNTGTTAMWAILAIGLFNSIMFPTIFSLSLEGLGAKTSEGSGILCMAIVGGAIIPLLQGFMADSMGLKVSFILPLACYLYIAYFGYDRMKNSIEAKTVTGRMHHA
ncbi:MAG: sugar MFS transporter [Bacteriovoracaceae bacterium]